MRHELDVVVSKTFVLPQGLRVYIPIADANVHVYERDTEVEAAVYADSEGGAPVAQPLSTDISGRIIGPNGEPRTWVEISSVDVRAIKLGDSYEQAYEAVSGAAQAAEIAELEGDGIFDSLRVGGFPDAATLLHPKDVVFGPMPLDANGNQTTPQGFRYDSEANRSYLAGAAAISETNDPPELILRRQAGLPRRGPYGPIALLAADVLSGASEFYLMPHIDYGFPLTSLSIGSTFKVGPQAIGYGVYTTAGARACGPTVIGATEMLIAQQDNGLPASGYCKVGRAHISYDAIETAFSMTLTAPVKAGDTSISVDSIPAGLPSAGTVAIVAPGPRTLMIQYTGTSGGNTLTGCTGVGRNVASGEPVTVKRLTGVRHLTYIDRMISEPAASGATELSLTDVDQIIDNPDTLPDSGTAKLWIYNSTTELTISWTGVDRAALKLTGVTGISQAVPYGSSLCFVNKESTGIQGKVANPSPGVWTYSDLVTFEQLSTQKFTLASGFTSAAGKGQHAKWDNRRLAPDAKTASLGLIHWDAWSTGGYQSRNFSMGVKLAEDAISAFNYGGQAVFTVGTVGGPNGGKTERRDVQMITDHGIGILGGGLTEEGQILYPLHVAAVPACRLISQRMSGTVTVSSSLRGYPTSGRFKGEFINREVGAIPGQAQVRSFDYTGISADYASFTGVTYDGTDGYSLADFYAEETRVEPGDRVKVVGMASKGQIRANEGKPGEVTIGNGGPTTANPEPSVRLGRASDLPLDIYRGTDGKTRLLRNGVDLFALTSDWIDTDTALAANSDVKFPTQKAVKAYIDALLAGANAMVFKGTIDCSGNPNYPAADAGHVYRVSVAGKIGGGSGPNVEVGDTLYCTVDGTSAGTHGSVGANWDIVQANIDGAVIGPASATDNRVAVYDGATGKLIKGPSTDVSLGTQKLVAVVDGTASSHAATKGQMDAADAAALVAIDARYRQIARRAVRAESVTVTGSGVYEFDEGGNVRVQSSTGRAVMMWYLDPANGELGIAGRSTKLRLMAACAVQDNAPGVDLVLGLYPVGTPSGGTTVFNPNLGTVTPGSTVTFNTPGANSKSAESSSGDFDCPAGGWYAPGVSISGGFAANCVVEMPLRLDVRNV